MKKLLAVSTLAVSISLGVTQPVSPATAAPTSSQVTTVVQAGANPIPTTYLSSYKFWPYTVNTPLAVCVAVGDTVAPIGKMAQAWNNATATLALDASPNCVADGYAPSMRMTVDTYSAPDGQCAKLTNTYYSTADSYRRWTGNPANVVAWVNKYYYSCWGTSLRRDKWTAIAIGEALGANELEGSSYAGRGMSNSSSLYGPSRNTDGVTMDDLYLGLYEGIY